MLVLNRDYMEEKTVTLALNGNYRVYEVSKADGLQYVTSDSTDKLEITYGAAQSGHSVGGLDIEHRRVGVTCEQLSLYGGAVYSPKAYLLSVIEQNVMHTPEVIHVLVSYYPARYYYLALGVSPTVLFKQAPYTFNIVLSPFSAAVVDQQASVVKGNYVAGAEIAVAA